ncbi:hypothetical protein FJU30_20030 [Affinibrenneria salicis]|uniref:Uncharacterized protein n=1 Tax=Affinibrenneria salicis TaxID=2590031 RepID=A0A5J5FUJ5_9GAMM|nr:hypothetical protein [Affinibrenneria salicis]KAA8996946.1 hypothetical protein FJU30_20030 [Affinibrenneria salicis]
MKSDAVKDKSTIPSPGLWRFIKAQVSTFGTFVGIGLLFGLLVQLGPGTLRLTAQSAIMEQVNAKTVSLLTIVMLLWSGLVISLVGSNKNGRQEWKARLKHRLIAEPAGTVASLIVPLSGIVFAMLLVCGLQGYGALVVQMLYGLAVMLCIVAFNLFIASLAREPNRLSPFGRLPGLLMMLAAVILYWWVFI